ncbi:MAG TPA: hypothetical protein VGF85_07235 [Opitutaceae bacterium]
MSIQSTQKGSISGLRRRHHRCLRTPSLLALSALGLLARVALAGRPTRPRSDRLPPRSGSPSSLRARLSHAYT